MDPGVQIPEVLLQILPVGPPRDTIHARSRAGTNRPIRLLQALYGHVVQERVHELFLASLVRFGVLALGHKESVVAGHEDRYDILDPNEKLYRRKR